MSHIPTRIDVAVLCEESQAVTSSFRSRGIEAYSVDLLPCSAGDPSWHLQMDVEDFLDMCSYCKLMVFHPPCTYMAVSGNRWYAGTEKRKQAIAWTKKVWEKICGKSARSALENPVSVIFSEPEFRRPQYIQPWQFGHGETKKTGFFLRNVPALIETKVVEGREAKIWKMPPSKERRILRSKTYFGVAEAIAEQWGALL